MRTPMVWLLLMLVGCESGGGSAIPPKPNDSHKVFTLDVLHDVAITVDPKYLVQLDDNANEMRVPCDIVWDGIKLPNAGIKKKGGIGSVAKIAMKTGWSIKFDEFVAGQTFHDLDKILLNNAKQDPSFLNEHLGYEISRLAGIIAPRTAHAAVTFNGTSYGVYVIAEAFDRDFLRRNFGEMNDSGNLYEGPVRVDFVTNQMGVELKDEILEKRSRADLVALAAAIARPIDPTWTANVRTLIDLDGFITYYAIESCLAHWDGYSWNQNNYYLYNDPARGKFVMMPHGMDQLWQMGRVDDPFLTPKGFLSLRVRAIPELDRQLHDTVAKVAREAYDVPALMARIDRVSATLTASTRMDARTRSDIAQFDRMVAAKRTAIQQRKMRLP